MSLLRVVLAVALCVAFLFVLTGYKHGRIILDFVLVVVGVVLLLMPFA